MNRKNAVTVMLILLLSALISSSIAALLTANFYSAHQFRLLSSVAQQMVSMYPEKEQEIIGLIREGSLQREYSSGLLSGYGYDKESFAVPYEARIIGYGAASTLLCGFVLCLLFLSLRRRYKKRIAELTGYLEKINLGESMKNVPQKASHKHLHTQVLVLESAGILQPIEDAFAPLQDEIYKTVTNLRQTKDAALQAREHFADNLANISHQIKTPITSISIMTQLLEQEWDEKHVRRIKKQTLRLEQLAKALLTLSRIDAGVLKLEKQQIDVYTLLQVSVEALDDIIMEKELEVSLPNNPEAVFQGDMEWSAESFINLLKNCAEHTPRGGSITINYSQNPLYTEIIISDNGTGFSEKDLPHVFERFYRGDGACKEGIGIGLSLARSIIELQNGIIRCKNLPEGGACFIVRFYSH